MSYRVVSFSLWGLNFLSVFHLFESYNWLFTPRVGGVDVLFPDLPDLISLFRLGRFDPSCRCAM